MADATRPAAEAFTDPVPGPPLRNPPLAALLAWLVPGLGHLYQGRTAKAVLFFVPILGLFVAGQALGRGRVVYWRADSKEVRWAYLAQVGIGLPALPAVFGAPGPRVGLSEPLATYQARPVTAAELGRVASGFNVSDTLSDEDRVRVLREDHGVHLVTDEGIDDLHRRYGKQMDIALIYTMIAGLLNVLAIYDALAGPALAAEEQQILARRAAREARRAGVTT